MNRGFLVTSGTEKVGNMWLLGTIWCHRDLKNGVGRGLHNGGLLSLWEVVKSREQVVGQEYEKEGAISVKYGIN